MVQFEKETKAIRPVSQAVNDTLGFGKLPSGPFNFGLYFNKWMYVVDGRFSQERLAGKAWACCGSDETKFVRNMEKVCDPNALLDNFDIAICLFNEEQKYSRRVPKERRNRDGTTSYKEDEGSVSVSEKWERRKTEALLKEKHKALGRCAEAYRKIGYEVLTCRAMLLSSLVIGLGNEHPTEKGFRFDWTMGVPYIPATGLKGVVRLAYLVNRLNELDEEDAAGFWERINNGLLEEDAQHLFGCGGDVKNGQGDRRGGILFFDAYPEELPRLAPEIMNCHYKDYLNSKPGERDFRGPTEDQQPNPQKYWAVSPWLDNERPLHFVFRMLVPKALANAPQYKKFRAAVQDALHIHGLGAKTAVGHGRFVDGSGTVSAAVSQGISEDQGIKQVPSAIEDEAFQKILRDVNLLTAKDKGKVGAIIEKLARLTTDRDKAAAARAIQERLGPKAFKDLKKRDFLLDLIRKVESS